MLFIIDGYNLVKTIFKKSYVNEKELNFFINLISDYTKKTENKVIVVFDGFGNISYRFNRFIDIIYSQEKSADDYIKDYLINYKTDINSLILITSDQEIKRFAYRLGFDSLDSYNFYHRINKKAVKKNNIKIVKKKYTDQIYKLSEKEDDELDELMVIGSNNISNKDKNIDLEKDRSKNSKKIDRVLKKI